MTRSCYPWTFVIDGVLLISTSIPCVLVYRVVHYFSCISGLKIWILTKRNEQPNWLDYVDRSTPQDNGQVTLTMASLFHMSGKLIETNVTSAHFPRRHGYVSVSRVRRLPVSLQIWRRNVDREKQVCALKTGDGRQEKEGLNFHLDNKPSRCAASNSSH